MDVQVMAWKIYGYGQKLHWQIAKTHRWHNLVHLNLTSTVYHCKMLEGKEELVI